MNILSLSATTNNSGFLWVIAGILVGLCAATAIECITELYRRRKKSRRKTKAKNFDIDLSDYPSTYGSKIQSSNPPKFGD